MSLSSLSNEDPEELLLLLVLESSRTSIFIIDGMLISLSFTGRAGNSIIWASRSERKPSSGISASGMSLLEPLVEDCFLSSFGLTIVTSIGNSSADLTEAKLGELLRLESILTKGLCLSLSLLLPELELELELELLLELLILFSSGFSVWMVPIMEIFFFASSTFWTTSYVADVVVSELDDADEVDFLLSTNNFLSSSSSSEGEFDE
jgi:hypothetical protein